MENFQKSPLTTIQSIFRESGCDQVKCDLEKFVEQSFKIPLINSVPSDQIRDGTLARYRGMIQDQFDPEFYLKIFSVVNRETGEKDLKCGMYHDVIDLQPGFEVDYESSDNITGDRQTLYVVPIPGEAQWIMEGTMVDSDLCGQGSINEQESMSYRPKRILRDEDNESNEEMDVDDDLGCQDASKKIKKGSKNDTGPQSGRTLPLNHPLPGETRSPCMIKVYNSDSECYTLNSVFEFVGIISSNPTLVNFESNHSDNDTDLIDPFGDESALERQTHCPPPSLIPRLHCIKATPLHHCHPNLPISLNPPITADVLVQMSCDVKTSRENLLELLTALLMGDHLAAEFTLLHLLSSVFGRTEMMSLGKFSFNLSRCPQFLRGTSSLPSMIYQVLEQLVTKRYLLQLTLSNLNSMQFIPQKDYQANKLQTGLLQLSSGTHLVVDETVMKPGQLGPRGVANIAALGGVVQSQRVKYDFKYHQQEMDCDIPVLILSDGKSLLNADCHVPLSASSSSSDPLSPPDPQAMLADHSEDTIAQIRRYLVLSKLLKYDLDDEIREKLQDDFVQRRRVDPQMTGDTFHYLLNLSRLITISHGEEKLSLQYWEHAKKMYMLQRQRVQN